MIGAVAQQSASSPALSSRELRPPGSQVVQRTSAPPAAPALGGVPRTTGGRSTTLGRDAITEDDGILPDGATVFDGTYPGVANIDPELLAALRAAATDAAADGVTFVVNSGWRSRDYQDELFREAVARYGSAREAARW